MLVNLYLPFATASLYNKFYMRLDMKREAKKMTRNLKRTFYNSIASIEWIDSETRPFLIRKLANMEVITGYPDDVLDDVTLNSIYKDLKLFNTSLLDNVLKIGAFNFKTRSQSFRDVIKRSDEMLITLELSPTYNPQTNSICKFKLVKNCREEIKYKKG